MGKSPQRANNLKALRERSGLTQDQAAAAFGMSKSGYVKIEDGDRGLKTERILKAAEIFGVRPEEVYGALAAEAAPNAQPNARRAETATIVDTATFKGPRNVPVLGTGVGGDHGDFRFNGQRIDHAPRPPGIANRLDVYAIYVVGDSMAPAYEDGTLIYVDPHRRPAPRDYVVVEKHGPNEDEPGDAFVKRLIRRSAAKVVVEQFNPKDEITFGEQDVKRVHRVIPWSELIGI
ncbi:LexA family transcriptional regulator [Methylobacterium radiodurans]|uniref:LexA family transcriptional repressor n=1 Tax=Methylobacterium radiodurans TaxID=2202828 RepID=A0A2U8VR25_9HYPH|nr:XRE family transcriptional regulator [Methylobacterium radiodurans]AWN35752.1 LexA family transcriptional repressor [Methylobacterium radiodurans]